MSAEDDADEPSMKEIQFTEFRTNLFALLRSVEQNREPILVTRFGKPLAEIHPIPIRAADRERLRAERAARDVKLINRYADELNKDAVDGLEYNAAISTGPGTAD